MVVGQSRAHKFVSRGIDICTTSGKTGQNYFLDIAAKSLIYGRDDRIRTCDPHTPSVMRYQAALRPDRSAAFTRGGGQGQVFIVLLTPILRRSHTPLC